MAKKKQKRRSSPPRRPYYTDIGRVQTGDYPEEWMGYEGQENYYDLPERLRRPGEPGKVGEDLARDIGKHYYRQAVDKEIGYEFGPPRHYPEGEYPLRGGNRTTVGGKSWNPQLQQHLERMNRQQEIREREQQHENRRSGRSYQASVPPPPREGSMRQQGPPPPSGTQQVGGLVPSDRQTRQFGREWAKIWGGGRQEPTPRQPTPRQPTPRQPEPAPPSNDGRSQYGRPLFQPGGRREYPLPPSQMGGGSGSGARMGRPLSAKDEYLDKLKKEQVKARKELDAALAESQKWHKKYRDQLGAPGRLPPGVSRGATPIMSMDPPPPPMPRLIPRGYDNSAPMDPPPPPMPRLVPQEMAQQRPFMGPETIYAPPAPPAQDLWRRSAAPMQAPPPPPPPQQPPPPPPPPQQPFRGQYGRRFPGGLSRIQRQYGR